MLEKTAHAQFTGVIKAFFIAGMSWDFTVPRKCNYICAYKESTAFATPTFVKLPNAQQHFVQISCTEFHPDRAVSTAIILFTALNERVTMTASPSGKLNDK